ncbi:Type II secretion system protein E [Pseudodesulfovibrio profundus]|uniref:Type II secretion system protein E n=1 Tax=Pseudodesulfovibrio profundus TaxID=57320 RepID=A0A2C8FCV8_9BACT|nr:CpaF family protein [Pseudodesulfovibrio profundus]MBC15683.1 pilus assembly protein CpaF [Desulfovibrio sp.]SOB59732.1 Type II secretion system protein E [Pseudodesulfovibrio profundus]|tara:strand:- start:31236 stop:32618 length:1383 start_codon:yes stop_codon:yes gene_type:complete
MSIAARLNRKSSKSAPKPKAGQRGKEKKSDHTDHYFDIKTRIHDRLIDMIDLSLLDTLSEAEMRSEISKVAEGLLWEEFQNAPLNLAERKRMLSEIQDEVIGLGPLEPYIKDPTVNDILVNGYKQVYVERSGKLELTPARFKDDNHLRKIIDRIVSLVGRRIDESQPLCDARLLDGSRVNAVIPPLAIDGPSLSIRKFSADPLEVQDLINFNSLTPEMADLMDGIVKARLNVLISGGTGSGKTTLLNCLSRNIPEDERIVTIEDAAELQLKQDHVVRLETRPANIEGKGEIDQRELVKNCLRMRPDRIIIGECRASEALDMLQAMNTGHDGSLTTIHANTPRDALMRLETMVSMAGLNLSPLSMKRYISSAVDVIIQATRLVDGTRKVISITEISGMEGEMITMQEIFGYEQTGISTQGKVEGYFTARGIRPKFADKLDRMGRTFPAEMFHVNPLARKGA